MLHLDAMLKAILSQSLKPAVNTVKQLHLRAVLLKRSVAEIKISLRLLHHLVHI